MNNSRKFKEISSTSFYCIIPPETDNFDFLNQLTQKVNTTIEFCIFELVLVPNFSLDWQF